MVKLKSSTLIEVLIAMIILLCVFGIGMMVFANLDRSSSNLQSRAVREQLRSVAEQYGQGQLQTDEVEIDSVLYFIEQEPLIGFQDRIKVKVYAQRVIDGTVIDSLTRVQTKLLTDDI